MNQFRIIGYLGPDHFVEIIISTVEKKVCKKFLRFVG